MMIGPMKKKVITASVVTAIILILIFAVLAFLFIKNNNEKLNSLKKEGEVVQRYAFSGDYVAGEVMNADCIKVINVKAESVPNSTYYFEKDQNGKIIIDDKYSIIGKKLKIGVSNNTLVSSTYFYDEDGVPNKDTRLQEYNMITLPSDLNVGDYIDIRLRLGTGEDYIVLVGKKVESFGASGSASNTIFLKLNEEEIIRMSSAVIESYLDDGIKLYANKYVDPDNQLFKYQKIDLVAKYNEARYAVEEGNFTLDSSGEIVKQEQKRERSVEEIADIIGVSVSDIESVKEAIENNDDELLEEYKNKEIKISQSIETTYPVRTEVVTLIKNNPNLLDTIKAKYNVAELEAQRVNLKSNKDQIDPLTGLPIESDNDSIKTKLDQEIEAQKVERQQYLRNLINSNTTSSVSIEE